MSSLHGVRKDTMTQTLYQANHIDQVVLLVQVDQAILGASLPGVVWKGHFWSTWVPGARAKSNFFLLSNSFFIQAKLGFPLQYLCATE